MRLRTTLIGLLLAFSVFARNNDITMVSYEQSWLDSEGTIALKNNTTKEVQKVVFEITYLDMDGNELDYEVFSKRVTIAPGKTKKINIPAYERSRNYHYYKTKDSFGHPKFKIKYRLKDYSVKTAITTKNKKANNIEKETNIKQVKTDIDDTSDSGISWYEDPNKYIIITLIAFLVFLSITIGSYVLVAVMAQRRNRNVALWILLSFVASPLLIIIILLCIGDENRED